MNAIPTPFKKVIIVGIFVITGAAALAFPFTGTGFGVIPGHAAEVEDTPAPEVGFAANAGSLGAIPDGVGCIPTPGPPRDVTFSVTGITGAPTSVQVSTTINHTFLGDLIATLIAPNGANIPLFGKTGATNSTGFGDSSDLNGTYFFTNSAVNPPSGGWWQEATARGATEIMTPGSYRTTGLGGTGQVNPAPPTDLSGAFSGVTNPNGTWTLRLTDGCSSDTGSITGALLILNGVASQTVLDYNGDGRTDWTVVRNIGGGPTGQVAWFTRYNTIANGGQTDVFGTAADFFISGDWDNDNRSDVAVWRPNATAAFFYILRSSDSTFVPVQWGKTGDDPSVVGDYDGDGKTDYAVYRAGASSGQQSFWHVLKSSDGGYLPIQWGQNGDFPAPGDYDGDGRYDAAVQRNAGGGSAIFFLRYFNGSFDQIVFGTPTDVIVPGDYDGDGKTDLAITRSLSGVINWFYDPSSIPGTQVVQVPFGASSTDFSAQGDYDGDGRTDQAVWRPSATPGQSAFYVNGSSAGFFAFAHGQNGDFPVANFNRH